MHEVTRSLHPSPLSLISVISICFIGDGSFVGIRQHQMCLQSFIFYLIRFTMLVLGIDVTTTLTRLHVDKVELYDTRYRAIYLSAIGVERVHEFEIYTRCQGHHVGARAVVTIAAVGLSFLELMIGHSLLVREVGAIYSLTVIFIKVYV